MLRITITVEEFIEGTFHTIHADGNATLKKEDSLKDLNIKYLRAKKFLEDNWHNGNGGS